MNPELVTKFAADLKDADVQELLAFFLKTSGRRPGWEKDRIALASSLGAEDQALTHLILSIKPDARIFVLDTGRLHEETYDVMDRTMQHYGMRYDVAFPNAADIEPLIGDRGPNLFYDSIENRKACCEARKVKPLRRILSTLDVWITGLRKAQSVTRSGLGRIEWDDANGLIKLNPLADWSEEQVWAFIRENDIPYNRLHDVGYPSIGCSPCTRAASSGEDIRAGRWWWEEPEHKECGLHFSEGQKSTRNL